MTSSDHEPDEANAADEIGTLLADLLLPNAGPAYDEIRGAALERLLSIGARAHQRLLSLADVADPLPQVLAVLPEFAADDAVPVLARALASAPDPTTVTAAAALADHPSPAAGQALEDALASPREQTRRAAELGLDKRRGKRS